MSLFGQFGRAGAVEGVWVTTQTQGNIKGVLVSEGRNALVLRAASVAGKGPNGEERWTKLVGDVVIPISNIDYYQRAIGVEVLD